jgi:hypothetical protein
MINALEPSTTLTPKRRRTAVYGDMPPCRPFRNGKYVPEAIPLLTYFSDCFHMATITTHAVSLNIEFRLDRWAQHGWVVSITPTIPKVYIFV